MSRLIDSFEDTRANIDGKWPISKPCFNDSFIYKLKSSIKVITGKSIAVHFVEDIIKINK